MVKEIICRPGLAKIVFRRLQLDSSADCALIASVSEPMTCLSVVASALSVTASTRLSYGA